MLLHLSPFKGRIVAITDEAEIVDNKSQTYFTSEMFSVHFVAYKIVLIFMSRNRT